MAGAGIGSAVAGDEGSGAHCPTAPRSRPRPSRPPPASPSPGVVAPGVPRGRAARIVDTASSQRHPVRRPRGLPARRGGHQLRRRRPATSPWQLIAAIGRVESDHGRFGGNVLDDDGVAQPGIYGIALDGTNDTQRITDTDAGQYDSDKKYDRAVGPDAVHPVDLVGRRRRRRQRRQAQPPGHRRRRAGDRGLPLLRRRRPVRRAGPARQRLPLQPLQRLRRPGPVDHAGLHGRRLHCPCRPAPPPPASSSPAPTRPSAPARDKDRGGKDAQQGTPRSRSPAPARPPHRPRRPTKTPTPTPTDHARPSSRPSSRPRTPPRRRPPSRRSRSPCPRTLPTLPSASATPLDQTLTYVQAVAQCTTQGVVDNPLTATNELADCANALLAP